MLAALVFVVDKKTDLISAPHALVYFGIVLFFVYFKVNSTLVDINQTKPYNIFHRHKWVKLN